MGISQQAPSAVSVKGGIQDGNQEVKLADNGGGNSVIHFGG